ncbi:GNAT family N-acetyltransferase [Clostridium omnivorum]|uniref:Acetyltransferase n=1 Tax=Clostridium omnivorum TaxID=1604902 RepID=A0ABQ5N7B1_9CLOT|nr:GNAT family N-acetyltransferase [Clostridium sp. E14]GLC31072.1 acetyltransferase [Clostridium sp. E14]
MEFKRCTEVDMNSMYSAFSLGFSDYIIKLEMPQSIFEMRFFGPEGNSLEYSFIAIDEEKPVGIILGGIKHYDGVKTLRCGTLAVAPEYRGKGISHKLMELHREEAIKQQCKQLFLEVIVGNDRAINFYKKLGYEKIYDLSYFSHKDVTSLSEKCMLQLSIHEIDIKDLRAAAQKSKEIHINWQNDLDYIEKLDGQINLGAYVGHKLVGVISANKNTRINYIWVEENFRHNGIGTNLVKTAAKGLGLSKLSLGFPNNASVQGFITHIGFTKDNIAQYEMYDFL